MSTPSEIESEATDPAQDIKHSPRADGWQALIWVLLGVGTLVESLRMDRLENQSINPYTIPGLLPAGLGVAIILLGLLMAYRSISRGALKPKASVSANRHQRQAWGRIWFILTLCVGFALGMVGHGLLFGWAAAIFITVMIVVLQLEQLRQSGKVMSGMLKAALIGVCAGTIITLVFQEFFLVRLP